MLMEGYPEQQGNGKPGKQNTHKVNLLSGAWKTTSVSTVAIFQFFKKVKN